MNDETKQDARVGQGKDVADAVVVEATRLLNLEEKDPEIPHSSDWDKLKVGDKRGKGVPHLEQEIEGDNPTYRWHGAVVGQRRRDGEYFYAALGIPYDATIEKAFEHLGRSLKKLNSFKDCSCRAGGVHCLRHGGV